jgi:hypothetical protein
MSHSTNPDKAAKQLVNLRDAPAASDGSQRAASHGVYARVVQAELEAKTAALYPAIGEDLPVRDPDGSIPAADAIPLRLLAETLIRRERVRLEELRHRIESKTGDIRGIVKFGLALDNNALDTRPGQTRARRAGQGRARAEEAARHSDY